MVTNWCLDCRKGIYPCKGAFLVNELVFFCWDSIYVFSCHLGSDGEMK